MPSEAGSGVKRLSMAVSNTAAKVKARGRLGYLWRKTIISPVAAAPTRHTRRKARNDHENWPRFCLFGSEPDRRRPDRGRSFLPGHPRTAARGGGERLHRRGRLRRHQTLRRAAAGRCRTIAFRCRPVANRHPGTAGHDRIRGGRRPGVGHLELVAAGHTLLHDAHTEPWGQIVARLLGSEGLLIGLSNTPWIAPGRDERPSALIRRRKLIESAVRSGALDQ